jgi:hypothetical protein
MGTPAIPEPKGGIASLLRFLSINTLRQSKAIFEIGVNVSYVCVAQGAEACTIYLKSDE